MTNIVNGRYALADPSSGLTMLSLEGGELNMFGSYTRIRTTHKESYPVIHDEPVELKIEKKPNYLSTFVYGFIGAAVSACLAAVAISVVASATVLTGGVALAACAFFGASLGALVATKGMVESDLRTGNNRNPIEFITGLTGGIFIGFAAGAVVYEVIAAAPALAAGVGQKAVMFLGETSFITKAVPEIIKVSAGVVAAAETTFSINDAYACGSGYNPLLDMIFDNNIEAYETIELCVDMFALGYVQAAETYGKISLDQGVYIEENENNLYDYDDGQLEDIADTQVQKNNKIVFKYKHDPSQNPKVLKDAVEDPNAVYGFRPRKDGSLTQFADNDWEDPIAVEGYRQDRIAYHNRNEGAAQQMVLNMTMEGASIEDIAKAICEYRNQSRINAYFNPDGSIKNMSGYQAALIRAEKNSYDNLIKGGKTPEQIIKSATKGNPAMDACTGLYDEYFDTY